jgi:hypothetical protein
MHGAAKLTPSPWFSPAISLWQLYRHVATSDRVANRAVIAARIRCWNPLVSKHLAASRRERFPNYRGVSEIAQGGFFLRKKPLGLVVSLDTNWRTAVAGRSPKIGDSRFANRKAGAWFNIS